jgi:signal transduction histidine kinase/ligand-binding sensor domain-containing protein
LQHINTDDGLSQNSVNKICQGPLGFIWLATGDGLNRYDGKELVVYKSSLNDVTAHLPDRNINSELFEDRQGRMWMSTDAGVSYWDRRRSRSVTVLSSGMIGSSVIVAHDDSMLWCAVPLRGLYAINTQTLKHVFYPFTDNWHKNRTSSVSIHHGTSAGNEIWMADEIGVLVFDKRRGIDKRVLIKEGLNSINQLSDGRFLLCASGGVYFLDPQTLKTDFVAIENESKKELRQWYAFAWHAQTNDIYIGSKTNGDLCKIDPVTHKYELLQFQNNTINTLFIDRSENLWIGTEGNGAFKLDIKPPKFFCYQPMTVGAENKNTLMVKSVYRDASGMIWMGTFAEGLFIYDPASKRREKIALPFPVETIFIAPIMKDSAGRVVVAGGENIVWFEPVTRKIVKLLKLPSIKSASFVPPVIYSIAEWKKGYYVVATNIGLYCATFENGIASAVSPDYFRYCDLGSWTYNVTMAQNGDIYQAIRGAYSRLRIAGDTVITRVDSGFRGLAIRHFYRSTQTPILWIASEQGLIAYNETTRKYKVFNESAGLLNSYVYAILPENDSSLWISTNQGISHVQVHYGNELSVNAINYTSKDGLQSNEFNTGAYYKCDDGTMIFGGISGINWFQPRSIRANPHKATPVVVAISVNDTLFASDTAVYVQRLELPFGRNTISLSLRSLEFTSTGQNMFAYKLEGLDKEWVYTSNDKVRYSNLQPGSYTFLLKTSNNDGVWNDVPLRMQIVIHPPYWQRWWFRSLVLVSLLSIVLLLIRYYVKQRIRVKTIELEKQQALYLERLRISKDVHDDLGSGLSKISLMAEMAQMQLSNGNVQNEIKHISTVSKDLIDNMRDLIWVLNPENTSLDNLVARIREYSADYLDGTPVNAAFDFTENIPALPITREAQRNILSTVKEAINNCVKHARANEILIALKLDNNTLRITVSDNGKGITKENNKGNGLRNMRQRVEHIGGSLAISSETGKGTQVDIRIPFEKMVAGRKSTTNA